LNVTIGGFLYFSDLPLNPDKSLNKTKFNEWNGDTDSLFHTSWGMINVGPMRLTQYRTKNFQCKRNEFYELNKECFYWYFDSETIDTSDIDNGFAWGKYWNLYGDKYSDMNQNVY